MSGPKLSQNLIHTCIVLCDYTRKMVQKVACICTVALVGFCVKHLRKKAHKPTDTKTILDVLPMDIIERIAAQTDAASAFRRMSVCKALNTEKLYAVAENLAKNVSKSAMNDLIHCIRRYVTIFNDPVVRRRFICNILATMRAQYCEAKSVKSVKSMGQNNQNDHRIVEFETMALVLRTKLNITLAHALQIIHRLSGFQAKLAVPRLEEGYDALRKYIIGTSQEIHINIELSYETCPETFELKPVFTYDEKSKKLFLSSPLHYCKNKGCDCRAYCNEQIRDLRKHIPSIKLHISKHEECSHMATFEVTQDTLNGFINMIHESFGPDIFINLKSIVPYMCIKYFVHEEEMKTWCKESFLRHVFTDRLENIHKVNRFLGQPWKDMKELYDDIDRYDQNFQFLQYKIMP